jgi:hypothetical protein
LVRPDGERRERGVRGGDVAMDGKMANVRVAEPAGDATAARSGR